MKRFIFSCLLATLLLLNCSLRSRAEDSPTSSSSAESSAASSSGKQSRSSSKSTAQSQSLPQLSHKLTELHDTVKHLKHAATNLIGEMNRTEMKILEYDDYINQYIDDKPVKYSEQLYPYGFQNIGNTSTVEAPMQPRKKWVDYYVGQLGDLMNIAQTEVQSVLDSPAVGSAPVDLTSRIQTNMSAIRDHLAKLTKLTSVDKYDNDAIQTEAAAIRDEGGDIDLCSRKLYRAAKEKAGK